ncbi:MAG: TIGR03560 family F420-dependent LLM class oxidoreductase [Solirubrobacteraceae bacterium]
MRAPIQLDLHLPNFNYPDVGPQQLLDKLTEIVRTAEDAGFTSVTLMDHLHQIPGVGPRTNWMLEGNAAIAALAARTSRIHLGLLVGGVMYRNPAFMAKATTTIDVLSGGRAFLGLGAAWFEEEHRAYGYEFPPLGVRFEHLEDALQIARLMFTQPESSFAGIHHHTEDVLNIPQPIRGDIPIVVGGSGKRKTLRMVAQYADGCNVFGGVDRVRELMGVLEEHCERVGRDPAEITKTRNGPVAIAPTQEAADAKIDALGAGIDPERLRQMMTLSGDPDTVGERAQELLDAGLDGLTVSLPDVHDLETVALAGATLAPLVA